MLKQYTTSAQIGAPLDRVWSILTDAPGYERWNPEILAVRGRFAPGETIKARVKVKAGPNKTAIRDVGLRITLFEPPAVSWRQARMEWTGGLPLGLFTGKRTLTLTPKSGITEFRMDLHMSGPMCGMIIRTLGDRQPEIDSFSAGLKAHAERA
jgi:hypothetical protein